MRSMARALLCFSRVTEVTAKPPPMPTPRRDRTPRRSRASTTRRRRTWLVWVDGYLRSDGVRVAGHYRSCLECPRED